MRSQIYHPLAKMLSLLALMAALALVVPNIAAAAEDEEEDAPRESIGRDQYKANRDQYIKKDGDCIGCTVNIGKSSSMQYLSGQWVEGDGDISARKGGSGSSCQQACLSTSRCEVAEFYRPSAKCSLFSYHPTMRGGGEADVWIKK